MAKGNWLCCTTIPVAGTVRLAASVLFDLPVLRLQEDELALAAFALRERASVSGGIHVGLLSHFAANNADQMSGAAPWAIYGVFPIALPYLMPSGVASPAAKLRRRPAAKKAATPAPPAKCDGVQNLSTGKEAI